MIASSCKYESLATKETFNASVRHVKSTVGLSERVAGRENLADALNELIDEKVIHSDQLQTFVSMLLIDKYGYYAASKNMTATISDFSVVQAAVKSWNAFDMVVLYQHPDLGVIAVNPKNPAHVSKIDRINKSELIVAYLGCFGKPFEAGLAVKAADALISLYQGANVKDMPALLKGSCSYKAPTPPKQDKEMKAPKVTKAASSKKGKPQAGRKTEAPIAQTVPVAKQTDVPKVGSRMTPMYGVLVTNELFHNGNVEAWKRIIDSFKIKHPDLTVLVYYDSERITNLNALFKWGKVKHGSVIQFAVAGENICDVAKLQRYLAQGASIMYEAFLRGPINGVLSLF